MSAWRNVPTARSRSRPVFLAVGDALAVLDEEAPDVRVINLETSVTRSADFAAGKAVCCRMSPDNLPAVTVARPDVCVLASNHVLDFGRSGLAETLGTLAAAGLPAAGAGRDAAQAWQPSVVPVPGGGRVVVFGCGAASSGIPPRWAARDRLPAPHFRCRGPMTSSPGPGQHGNPVTSWSYPSTGVPPGVMT